MEIPNTEPNGGELDGMGDLEDAPVPPMGSDLPPMDNEPQAPMEEPMEEPQGGGDDAELEQVIDSLPMEKKAAVLKYAKSMADSNEPQPMEGKKTIKSIIDETISDILNGDEEEREKKELPKEYDGMESPFKAPSF